MKQPTILVILALLAVSVFYLNSISIRVLEVATSKSNHRAGLQAIRKQNRNSVPRIISTLPATRFNVIRNYAAAAYQASVNDSLVTYVTQGDYRYLHHLVTIVQRWAAPVSVAIFLDHNFNATLGRILDLQRCQSPLIREWVTFHIVMLEGGNRTNLPRLDDIYSNETCSQESRPVYLPEPWKPKGHAYYPINTLRNVARSEARTRYVLVSDLEVLPSPHFSQTFFELLTREQNFFEKRRTRFIFVLPIFEIDSGANIPNTKVELVRLLQQDLAVYFHMYTCQTCQYVPDYLAWIKAGLHTKDLNVFSTIKRHYKALAKWEPLYVGTKEEPAYDEDLPWEGHRDKIPQVYKLCLLDYDFMILDNAFLVHKGIQKEKLNLSAKLPVMRTQNKILRRIKRESQRLFGQKKECSFSITFQEPRRVSSAYLSKYLKVLRREIRELQI